MSISSGRWDKNNVCQTNPSGVWQLIEKGLEKKTLEAFNY
jgi:hypothetical protein